MHSLEQSSDSLWWQRLKEDDSGSLAYFYEKYADWLLSYGLSVAGNRDIVKDALQELFLQIWNRRRNLSDPDSVKFYLMVSLRRLILKSVKDGRTFSETMTDIKEEEEGETEELHRLVLKAVRSLPPRQQELIFLKYYEQMSYDQIAEATGLDYQILRNTIYRAVKSLKDMLLKYENTLISLLLLIIPVRF